MKTTIKDVARAAGVSPSTVSRALQHNPRISEEARARIQKLAEQMDFHPNQMARSLVNRRTRIIGIVFPGETAVSLGHPFYPRVLQGLGHVAGERRYHLLLGTGAGEGSAADTVSQLVDSGYVSGLILLAAEDGSALGDVGVPVVTVGHPLGGTTHRYVDNDNVEAGRFATAYLLKRGHRRVLLLGYDPQYVVTVDRRRGYEQALAGAGLPFRRDWVVPSPFLYNTTDQALLKSLFLPEDRPTAVVCMDDAQAIGLASTLSVMGLRVPDDVSVISFNNTEAGRYHNPPLTSIDVDPYQLGAAAMNMMLELLHNREPAAPAVTAFRLIERESVKSHA